MLNKEYRVRACAAVHDHEGRTLCVQHRRRGLAHWTLPGGAPRRDECLDAALIREVEEETGYRLQSASSLRSGRCGERWVPNLVLSSSFAHT
mgnify:CR=1 FL=1